MPSDLIDQFAKAFCEASGVTTWEQTPDSMKAWYREGVRGILSHVMILIQKAALDAP